MFKASDQNLDKASKNPNTKIIVDFNCESYVSINSLAVNKNNNVKVTARLFSGKMLMLAKLLLMGCIYKLRETFYFPSKKTIEIYKKYNTKIIFPYHILTDTDSTYLFLVIFNVKNNIPNKKFRLVLFEVIAANKTYDRSDNLHSYWENFNARKPHLQKCFEYFEIESTDNLCEIGVTLNPKEYYKHFKGFRCNKKRNGMEKGSSGMNFENFFKRVVSINEIKNFGNSKKKYQEQQKFSVVGDEMQKASIMKT